MMTTTCAVCELHAESTFSIEGMDCREEVAMLERRFKNLKGLEDFSADVIARRLHVKYDAAKLTTSAIADAVADTGMRAWLEHEEPVSIDGDVGRDALPLELLAPRHLAHVLHGMEEDRAIEEPRQRAADRDRW